MTPQKKVIIIAGPNGAGKTTFAREFLPAVSGDLPASRGLLDVVRQQRSRSRTDRRRESTVSDKLRSALDNQDMQAAPQALRRAARRAREIARLTGTRLVVVHGGTLRELDPDSPELPPLSDELTPKDD